MTDRELKLVKSGQSRSGLTTHMTDPVEQPEARPVSASDPALETQRPVETPDLTEAEAAEAARFKAMIVARAARQTMLHRIIAELEAFDKISSAA